MNPLNLSAITDLSRDELIGIAVKRGCRHYAAFVSAPLPEERPAIPHEVLGCALLCGPADVDTFQAIRVGCMVLSDKWNSPELIAAAAAALKVADRVAHIARLGLVGDTLPEFWRAVLACLPMTNNTEGDFLPGLSRFRSETHMTGLGRGPSFTWLRTTYQRPGST